MFQAANGKFLRASKAVVWGWLVKSVLREGKCLLRTLHLLLGERRDQDDGTSDISG